MKDASLPPGIQVVRCWCSHPCKVKEVADISVWFGMKFFMCPNYEHDPPVPDSPYDKPPSPPPLCPYYRWIDTEQPEWAIKELNDLTRRSYREWYAEEIAEKAAAREKAERERES